jgi:hypothetical protein
MAKDSIKNRVLGSFGIDTENPPTLQNTVTNIKKKGILGSVAQGAVDTANAAAIQSTNFGKAFLEGGKSVANTSGKILFGTDQQETQGGSGGLGASTGDASGVGVNKVTPAFASINPSAPSTQIAPAPLQTQLGNTIAPQSINNPLSQSGSTLNINTPSGGQGSISFQDGRTLSDTQKTRLANTINYNSLQSTKDNFAREAEIVANRRAEGEGAMQDFAFKQGIKDLLPSTQALVTSKRDLKKADLVNEFAASQAKALQAETAGRLGRDKLAMDAIKIQDQQDFDRQKLGQQSQGELVKLLSSPEGQSLGLKDKLAASRKMTGKVDINTFKMVHDQDFINNALQSEDSLIQSLAQQGYPQEDALSVLDSWRQSERNK